MAIRADITEDKEWFFGEDKLLRFEVLDASGNPVDPTGWALQWVLRLRATDTVTPLVSKTTGAGVSLTGTYNATRSLNTQRVVVTVLKAAIEPLRSRGQKKYQHSLRRTDDGSGEVLSYGDVELQVAS